MVVSDQFLGDLRKSSFVINAVIKKLSGFSAAYSEHLRGYVKYSIMR